MKKYIVILPEECISIIPNRRVGTGPMFITCRMQLFCDNVVLLTSVGEDTLNTVKLVLGQATGKIMYSVWGISGDPFHVINLSKDTHNTMPTIRLVLRAIVAPHWLASTKA